MSNFQKSLDYVLANEGTDYVNKPDDYGGPTKLGITIATLRRYRQLNNQPAVTDDDVKNLSLEEATAIYQAFFWKPLLLDQVEQDNKATAVFDVAVNMGPASAIQFAQKAVGSTPDGKIGPLTIFGINKASQFGFLYSFISSVQEHYIADAIENPSQLQFLKGWLMRAQRLISLMA